MKNDMFGGKKEQREEEEMQPQVCKCVWKDPFAHAFLEGPFAHAFLEDPFAHAFLDDPFAHAFLEGPFKLLSVATGYGWLL